MFELDEYSTGFHDGFLNKYSDSNGPALDFYLSDSLQDLLDIDIRKEIASVVGGSNEPSMVSGLPSSFDHATDTIASSIKNSNNSSFASNYFASYLPPNPQPPWSDSSWSISSDYHADVGACVNPALVMPMLSNAINLNSPKKSVVNAGGIAQPLTSPSISEPKKSHLSFSPAQVKIKAGSIRHEQLLSHIPKQIVSISSSITTATTAPATLATNSLLQRKNGIVIDTAKKDLGVELRKADDSTSTKLATSTASSTPTNGGSSMLSTNGTGSILHSNATNTIKLGAGIGGLTFANSVTYNKIKQQAAAAAAAAGVKSPQGSPMTANGTIVLKRDRDASPMGSIATNNQHITKILARNVVHTTNGYTPKSIASAHSPLMQNGSIGSPTSSVSSVASAASVTSSPSTSGHFSGSSSAGSGHCAPKTNQRNKVAQIESEFPKPAYSYSCLIALALKNSRSGSLPVSEIYSFMCEHFPYFKTAPNGWKNSVRHNLSLNNSFQKIEPVSNGTQRKGCFWAMNPDCVTKMDGEVQKWSRKDPMAIRNAMVYPEHLEALERGEMKHGSTGDSDVELDSQSEIEETSDLEEHELDDAIVDNMFVEEDIDEDEMMSGMMHHTTDSSTVEDGEVEMGNCTLVGQQHHDYDIEVEDIYDTIDVEDEKESVGIALSQPDIIELSPSDMNSPQHSLANGGDFPSPKRARLSINYSIGPAGELEKQLSHQHQQQQQQQQQQHTFKQVKIESFQPSQFQQHQIQLQQQNQQPQQQQQFIVHTIGSGNGGGTTSTIQTLTGARSFTKTTQAQYIIATKCN